MFAGYQIATAVLNVFGQEALEMAIPTADIQHAPDRKRPDALRGESDSVHKKSKYFSRWESSQDIRLEHR
jgi:hypothetical protein